MTLGRIARLFGLIAACLLGTAPAAPAAGDYPARPIRLIVPTGAGGITDLLARIVAEKLQQAAGQPVVVDNRPGAGGIIGSRAVATAAPDGYTLLFAYPTHTVNPSLYAKLPYDTRADFAPVTMVSVLPVVLVVAADSPFKSLQDLVAAAKAKPGVLNYSSVGDGSLGFLAAELLARDTGIKIVQITYKGTPQATLGVLGGETSLLFDAPLTVEPLIQAGKLRALGVTSRARLPSLPDVPAIGETIPGYEALGGNGILAPKGTPAAVIDRLNQMIVKILREPEVERQLTERGFEVVGNSPQAFAARIEADVAKWGDVVRSAGIKAQ